MNIYITKGMQILMSNYTISQLKFEPHAAESL